MWSVSFVPYDHDEVEHEYEDVGDELDEEELHPDHVDLDVQRVVAELGGAELGHLSHI